MDSGMVRKIIGAKFVRGGRDPAMGIDCQGGFLIAMRAFGHNVLETDVSEYSTRVVAAAISGQALSEKWEKIDRPEPGCAVVMAIDPHSPGLAQHLGVYIGEQKFVHVLENRGGLLSRIDDRFFSRKIRGFYRFRG